MKVQSRRRYQWLLGCALLGAAALDALLGNSLAALAFLPLIGAAAGLLGGGGGIGGALGGGDAGAASNTVGDFNFGGSSAKRTEAGNVKLYIFGALAALLLILAAVWLFNRKK